MNRIRDNGACKRIDILTARHHIPIYIFWELTRQCNLNCLHCYIKKEKRGELSFEEIASVINKLKNMKALIINFSGGEIFVRKDFFKIAKYAKDNNFAIKLFTNGTVIDLKTAERLRRLKPLCVEISIYSRKADIHDRITKVKGSWEKSMKALNYLLGQGIRVKIKCSLIKENFSTFSETRDFFKNLRIKYQFNPVLMPRLDGNTDNLENNLSRTQRIYVARNLNEKTVGRFNRKEILQSPMCSAGINSLTINAYGDLMPCIAFPIKLGNALRKDPETIWAHSQFLQEIRGIKRAYLIPCRQCKHLQFCARCPGIAYLKTADYKQSYREACELAYIRKRQTQENRFAIT